jgi:FtsZ-binding cell division protein ZapB
MKLEQFDQLQKLIKQTSDLVVRLKFENKKLKDDNEKLQLKISNSSNKTVEQLKRLKDENVFLRQRQEKVNSRLMHLRNKVKSLKESVGS